MKSLSFERSPTSRPLDRSSSHTRTSLVDSSARPAREIIQYHMIGFQATDSSTSPRHHPPPTTCKGSCITPRRYSNSYLCPSGSEPTSCAVHPPLPSMRRRHRPHKSPRRLSSNVLLCPSRLVVPRRIRGSGCLDGCGTAPNERHPSTGKRVFKPQPRSPDLDTGSAFAKQRSSDISARENSRLRRTISAHATPVDHDRKRK